MGAAFQRWAAEPRLRRWAPAVALAAAIVATCGLVALTYPRIGQTADEPNHLAMGLGWWQRGAYVGDVENPPLARIAIGALPNLAGLVPGGGDAWQAGTDALYRGGDPQGALALARLGVLPFLALALAVVFAWARWLGGRRAGALALVAVATAPPVLAHAGLATTDLPHAATLCWALYAAVRWADTPTWGRALALGVAVGAAVATKLSTVAFLPAALVAMAALPLTSWLGARWRGPRPAAVAAPTPAVAPSSSPGSVPTTVTRGRRAGQLAVAATVAALAVWATYRGEVGRAVEQPGMAAHLATCARGGGVTGDVVGWLAVHRLPAPTLIHGLAWVCAHDRNGHPSYLLGQVRHRGHRGFYLIALAVKTPLPLLLAVPLAMVGLGRRGWRSRRWGGLAPLAAAAAVVAVASSAHIHIGVRHVLVVYPLVAVALGVAVAGWLDHGRARVRQLAVAGAVALQLVSVARAFPHYLTYFNPLAGDEPGAILLDSDLDWGQGLPGLAAALRGQRVEALHLAYFGTARPCAAGLPPLRWLAPTDRPRGWIAISEAYFRGLRPRMFREPCDPTSAYTLPRAALAGYAWLAGFPTWARVGGLRIYDLR